MYFVDAGAARTALVGGRGGQARGLHRIEVVQQTDPKNAGDDVQPAGQARERIGVES